MGAFVVLLIDVDLRLPIEVFKFSGQTWTDVERGFRIIQLMKSRGDEWS